MARIHWDYKATKLHIFCLPMDKKLWYNTQAYFGKVSFILFEVCVSKLGVFKFCNDIWSLF